MFLGIDANGRSLRWAKPGGNGVEGQHSIVGIPPSFPDERFIWNNPAAVGAAEPLSSIPLELAWDRLAYIQPQGIHRPEPLRWRYLGAEEQSSLDPASAVAEAIAQNAPVREASDLIAISVPNHLDETGQDDLISALQTLGLFSVRLLWRPIALAFSWAQENASAAAALADNNRSLWVIDLESRGLEITRLLWRRHETDRNYVCPVRSYPRRDDYNAAWCSRRWAAEVVQDLCGKEGSVESLLRGTAGSDMQRFLEDLEHGPLVFQSQSDTRRWSQAKARPIEEGRIRSWVEVLSDVAKSAPRDDRILLHGWPARHVSEALAHQLSHPVEVTRQSAVAEGAAFFAKRVHARLPTYYDTLPQYAIWAALANDAGQKTFTWKALNPESVIDAGKEWILSQQEDANIARLREDTFSLARHIDRFSLLVQNKTLYDEDTRGNPETNNIVGKRLAVDLPTMTTQQEPLRLEMSLRPASGHAKFTISSKESLPIFEDRNSVDLSWKTAEDEPEHKGYLEAREVVGRIMDKPKDSEMDKRAYREMACLITRRIQGEMLHPRELNRLQVLLDDYRPGRFDVVNANELALLKRVLEPWGYNATPSQPTRGLWGSRRQYNDPELDGIAREMGEVLFHWEPDGNWYKWLNYMFVYTPAPFVDRLREDLRPGRGTARIFTWNQVIAAGRVFDNAADFQNLIRFSLECGFVGPDHSYTQHYWWSFFRCLCYHQNTARVAPALVYEYLEALCAFAERNDLTPHDFNDQRRKHALHALLFALRLRESSQRNENDGGNQEVQQTPFMPLTDPLVARFNRLFENMRLAGQPFPPAMLTGMLNMVKPGDNFSKYVWRFLNYRDDLADRELGAGLATS